MHMKLLQNVWWMNANESRVSETFDPLTWPSVSPDDPNPATAFSTIGGICLAGIMIPAGIPLSLSPSNPNLPFWDLKSFFLLGNPYIRGGEDKRRLFFFSICLIRLSAEFLRKPKSLLTCNPKKTNTGPVPFFLCFQRTIDSKQ